MAIKNILILGAGTMGQMISTLCAEYGYTVHVYDITQAAIDGAEKRITRRLCARVGAGTLSEEKKNEILSCITYFTDPEKAAANIDLVNESVPEDPGLKGRVFKTFHDLCKPETIFTTNTSSLLPSQFAEATGRPEKLCALHFHDTRITKIVDIMPHDQTAPETIEAVTNFARAIGQIPIVLEKENNGYVFNNMLMSLMASALTMAQKNVTSIEAIDKSWMGVMHTAMGPFGIMDSIGLDTVWKVTDYWANKRNDGQARANAAFIKSYIDQGKTGMKSGAGFYDYPNPGYLKPEFLK